MADLLIAVVGDANPSRQYDPPMRNAVKASKVAEELGGELSRRGVRLLVYGGPFIESDFVRGYVAAKPPNDHRIVMWYSKDQEPPPFPEEANHPRLFERRAERGTDWEVAFYRSIARANGVILIGGGNATKISGQVAIGTRLPLLALAEFGGAAAKVWSTLSAGEDLPNRAEIDLMARPWSDGSAAECVDALLAQHQRRALIEGMPPKILPMLALLLFLAALAIVPWVWGGNLLEVWMLFVAPVLAGGAGALLRPIADRLRGVPVPAPAVLTTVVLGLVAGGIAGVFFVTAQLTGDPTLVRNDTIGPYARRSIPFALGVGFVAGFTADVVFGKILGLDVLRSAGVEVK
jgi:hypothetical protein